MSQIAHSMSGDPITDPDHGALERRIFRVMIISVIVASVLSAVLGPWRFTAGLMLGGTLSLFNYAWLHSSVAAIMNLNATGGKAKARSSRYLLRYLVIGAVVFISYQLQLVSLPATIAGLCAFVPALFVEAFRQFYFAIVHREESC
jgi:ATP synthase I subunit